jgi:tetratricopeptide (TPR) repeat protein
MRKPRTVKKVLKQYWDIGVIVICVLIAVISLGTSLTKPLNILNEPWSIPFVFIAGYVGFISTSLFISERRRHTLRLRVMVRAMLIVAIMGGLFLGYRQFTLITNPPGRILAVIAVDADRGVPESREIMNRIWQELNTEVNLRRMERVKIIQREITVTDRKAAERILAQGKYNILMWMYHTGTEDFLNLSIAGDRLPEMIGDILGIGEKQKAGAPAIKDTHMILDVEEAPGPVVKQAVLCTIGLIYYNDHEYGKAIAYFSEALDRARREEPHLFGRKALYRFLGLGYSQSYNFTGALEYYEKLVALDPDDCTTLDLMAGAHYDLGEFDDVIEVCQRILDLDPANAGAYLRLASVYKDQGDLEKAEGYLRKAIELEPEKGAAHNNLGVLYAAKGDYEEAIAKYKKAIEMEPNNALAHANLGVAYEMQEDARNAVREYQLAVKNRPRSAYYHYLLGGGYWKLGTQGGFAMAKYEFRKANSLDPFMELNTSTELGFAYVSWGDEKQAIREFTRAIELAARLQGSLNASMAYSNRGAALGKFEDYQRALVDCNKAIELNPKNKAAFVNRGLAYHGLKEDKKAIADLDIAIELDSNCEKAYYNRGLYYYESEEYKKAIADFNEVIRLNSEHFCAHYKLGCVYKERGERRKAIESLEKALEITKTGSCAEEARKLLEELREKDDSTPHSHIPTFLHSSPAQARGRLGKELQEHTL